MALLQTVMASLLNFFCRL